MTDTPDKARGASARSDASDRFRLQVPSRGLRGTEGASAQLTQSGRKCLLYFLSVWRAARPWLAITGGEGRGFGRPRDARFVGLWDRLFDNGDKDGTNEAKDDGAVKPNEPIAHLPYVSLNTGILLADMVEALFHALGELVELIFAEKRFSHSDVPPNVEILS